MTLKKMPDDEKVTLEDEDACLIIHAAGHLGVFIPQERPHSAIAKAIMFFAISIQRVGVEPFAERYDEYKAQNPEGPLMTEVTLQ